MTSFECQCGTEIHYSSVRDDAVHCLGCKKMYIVDADGKLQVHEKHDDYIMEVKDIMEANE